MSEQRTSFSSRIIKRRDPKRAMIAVVALWLFAAGLGLFIPEAWGTQAVIIARLLNSAVLGAVIFFFAQDRKKWRGISIVFFAASILLETLFFIRNHCHFSIFLFGMPGKSLQDVFSDSALLLSFIRTIFYQLVFGFALVVSSLLRFFGRARWWAIVAASSVSMLACSVIDALPVFIASEQQASFRSASLVELGVSLLCAVAIFSAAVLFDWLCSFSVKALYLNRAAMLWCVANAIMSAALFGLAAASFSQVYDNVETLLFAFICAVAYVMLLIGKREGMAVLVFAFVFTILAACNRAMHGSIDILTFVMLAVGAFVPTITWLIFANSWQNTAPPPKKAKEKKMAAADSKTRISLAAVTAASTGGTISTPVPIPAFAGPPKQAPIVSIDMTQSIPIVTQLPPQASSKELKRLAKQQMAQQQAVWTQQQREAVLREREVLRKQKELQAQQKAQDKQKLREQKAAEQQQKEQEKLRLQQEREKAQLEKEQIKQVLRDQQAQEKLQKEQELNKINEEKENQKQQKIIEKEQQVQAQQAEKRKQEEAQLKQAKEKQEQKKTTKQGKKAIETKQAETEVLPAIEIYPQGFCDQCGQPVHAGSRFCMMCGLQREPLALGEAKAFVESAAALISPVSAEKSEIAARSPQKEPAVSAAQLEQPQPMETPIVLTEPDKPKTPKAINISKEKKVYVRTDNCGTMHKNVGQATSYWVMRRPTMTNRPPFLLYTFRDEASARDALLTLSFIHTAVDTGEMICDFLMEYGYYALFIEKDEPQYFEAVVCGHDLTPQRYIETKSVFESFGGQLKSEQAPLEEVVKANEKADVNAVVFKEEFVDNGKYRYRVFYAPNRASAIEFLRRNTVDEEYFYLMIDTPDGSFGRDIDGMYEV